MIYKSHNWPALAARFSAKMACSSKRRAKAFVAPSFQEHVFNCGGLIGRNLSCSVTIEVKALSLLIIGC